MDTEIQSKLVEAIVSRGDSHDSAAVRGAARTISQCPALELLRSDEREAKELGWTLHGYVTNGKTWRDSWWRGYRLHPTNKPRPRRYAVCDGAGITVNREGRGPGSHFYRQLLWLRRNIGSPPGPLENSGPTEASENGQGAPVQT